jgi:starch phosphorylase
VNLGNEILISAQVFLDCLKPEDVSVQSVSGNVGVNGEIKDPEITVMNTYETEGAGCYRFRGSLHTKKSGFLGYTLRILPNHSQAVTPFIPLLITWASESSVHAPELALK